MPSVTLSASAQCVRSSAQIRHAQEKTAPSALQSANNPNVLLIARHLYQIVKSYAINPDVIGSALNLSAQHQSASLCARTQAVNHRLSVATVLKVKTVSPQTSQCSKKVRRRRHVAHACDDSFMICDVHERDMLNDNQFTLTHSLLIQSTQINETYSINYNTQYFASC